MKLLKFGALTVLAAGGLCIASYTAGCSSPTPGPDAAGGGGIMVPMKPSGPDTTSMTETTFAINALLLGDTARAAGSPTSTTAWKDYGFDVDGKCSDNKSTDVCTRAAGAPSSVQQDGNKCRDNSFGANILPIIQSAGSIPNPSQTISDSITKGSFTIQLKVKGLAGPKQTNTGLSAQLFASGVFDEMTMKAPTFSPTDDWPVRPELLNDGKTVASGSKVTFPGSYITDGTFVTPTGNITISLVFQGVALDIEIVKAVIVMNIDGDNATEGTIAGVIPTEKLIGGLQMVAGRISKSLCGSAFDGIAQQIRQTSDILSDGSNAPGKACDAISIGLGFTAKHIANPTKVAALGSAPPDPCAMDSGVQDSGGGG